jgi:uncharacterized protein (DUF4415 family)
VHILGGVVEWDPEKAAQNLKKHGVDAFRASRLREQAMKKNYDFSKGKRGPVIPTPPGKTRITIRIDDDLLEWFRKRAHEAGGGSYQTMINQALREYVETEREPLEDTLRRVLREVLPKARKRGTARKKAGRTKASKKRA